MLYSEFVNGTGCKENDHNYKIYNDLEVLYMNSDLTKQQIYEYGKKLVDNSKTEEEIERENEIKKEIEELKKEYKTSIKFRDEYRSLADFWRLDAVKELYKSSLYTYQWYKEEAKRQRARIRELKTLI